MSSEYVVSSSPTHVTKTVVVAISLIVFGALLTGCNQNQQRPGGSSRSGVEAEAQQEAEKYWGSLLTKCGGTVYGKDNRRAVDQIYEFRDVSIRVKSRALSDADKMNDIEWGGDAYLDSKTSRVLTGDKWGPWREGSIYLNSEKMEKASGQWKFGVSADARPPLRTFDCSELP